MKAPSSHARVKNFVQIVASLITSRTVSVGPGEIFYPVREEDFLKHQSCRTARAVGVFNYQSFLIAKDETPERK